MHRRLLVWIAGIACTSLRPTTARSQADTSAIVIAGVEQALRDPNAFGALMKRKTAPRLILNTSIFARLTGATQLPPRLVALSRELHVSLSADSASDCAKRMQLEGASCALQNSDYYVAVGRTTVLGDSAQVMVTVYSRVEKSPIFRSGVQSESYCVRLRRKELDWVVLTPGCGLIVQ